MMSGDATLKTGWTGAFLCVLAVVSASCGAQRESRDGLPSRAANAAGPPGVAWHAPIEIAAGEGHRGPWRMNQSDWRFVDDPTVAINAHGFLGVAWAYHDEQDILFQLYLPDGQAHFEVPINVSRSSGTFSWLPRMILTDGDHPDEITVYLLWQEIVFSGGSHGGEIFLTRSTNGGRTFSPPENLSDSAAGAGKGRLRRQHWHNGSYDLVCGPQGELYVAWTAYEGELWFRRSKDGGETFSSPVLIDGGDEAGKPPARGPTLAVDDQNRIYLAWTLGEVEGANIHIATSEDGGQTFSMPQPVHRRNGHSDAPSLAVDSRGKVHLAFMESPDGPFQAYHVRYAQADRASLSFQASLALTGPLPERFASNGFPSLRLDGQDRIFLTWELFPGVRVRPLGLGFALSEDGGQSFTKSIVVPGTGDRRHGFNGSQQGLLMRKLAVNRAGMFAIVNSTFRPGEASRVWLIRGDATPVDF